MNHPYDTLSQIDGLTDQERAVISQRAFYRVLAACIAVVLVLMGFAPILAWILGKVRQ